MTSSWVKIAYLTSAWGLVYKEMGLSGRPTLTGVVDTNNDQKLSAGDVGKIEFFVSPIPPDTSHVGKGEVILTQKQIDSFNSI